MVHAPVDWRSRFREEIPRDFARLHRLVAADDHDRSLRLLITETTPRAAVHNACVRLGAAAVEEEVRDATEVVERIDALYGRAQAPEVEAGDEALAELLDHADLDLLSVAGKAPLVRLVDGLIFEAVQRGASDVHVQPMVDRTLVRLRVDGMLAASRELPRAAAAGIVARVKVMGRMDIAEHRLPQDGRATVRVGDRPVDLRISTIPTSRGERAVLRLLHREEGPAEISELGMPQEVHERVLMLSRRAHGMILVTGPTGSGKTTTLYAILRHIAAPGVNVMTIEDPIEQDLSQGLEGGGAISQSQTNDRKGVTFATGLRHILRQDPDVVMVGEIRDGDTARIAVQASLTGHLVLSTLHTNDAAGALIRLVDLGIQPYLVSSALLAVMAQRLVRCMHRKCDGKGCAECQASGFLGRRGLFELLIVDDRMRGLLARNAEVDVLRRTAVAAGMRTLTDEAQRLVDLGETTRAEALRVVEGLA